MIMNYFIICNKMQRGNIRQFITNDKVSLFDYFVIFLRHLMVPKSCKIKELNVVINVIIFYISLIVKH